MSMTRKTITITDQMENWIRAQIDSGRYGNDSEYIRDLVRRDKERLQAEMRLGEMIDAAEADGLSEKSGREVWEEAARRHTNVVG